MDNYIDVNLCFDTFHMFNEPQKVLKEFHRDLKSNGNFSLDCLHLKEIKSKIMGMGLFKLEEKIEKTFNFTKII